MLIKKNIPNAITLMNLLAGILAILFILKGELVAGSLLIGIALAMDFLDGFLARLLHAQSPIGGQLDSLADLVSFGVAPGFILYVLMSSPHSGRLAFDSDLTPYLTLLIPLFSAIRLAIFNIDSSQQYTFRGLPTPATAIFIGSIPLILWKEDPSAGMAQFFSHPLVLLGIVVLFSFLMVAPVSLLSLKFKNATLKANWHRYFLLLFAVIMIIFFHLGAFPIIILFYILLSLFFVPQRIHPTH